jgi:methionyl aminopeptidase
MITIKSEQEIEIMRQAGRKLGQVMKELKNKVEIGITTKELDRVAEALILKFGAEPAFKGYDGFPATLCASVNKTIVHGVPSDYQLKNGDILSLDIGLKYKEFFSDMAITLPVGEVKPEIHKLIEVTKKSLELSINAVKVGITFGDIGGLIEKYVKSQKFDVIRELCGHGIGKDLHEDPQILNYKENRETPEIKLGMVFCFEPMVTAGDWRIKLCSDGSGWQTQDDSLSAHFEHTIAVTKNGPEVLTKFE